MAKLRWVVAGLPDGVTVRRIDLRRGDRGFGGETMLFNSKVIGRSEQPLYAAARWLLANNAAGEGDTIATYRDGTLSMHGIVGDLAKWAVVETKHGNPSLSLRPYVPFKAFRLADWPASAAEEASVSACSEASSAPSPGGRRAPAWKFNNSLRF